MIGIIGAMRAETDGLLSAMTEKREQKISGMTFVTGKLGKNDIVVATCGIGKVNAAMCAEAMILGYHPDGVINSGVAGGLSKELKVADIVVATALVQHDMDTTPLGEPRGWISGADTVEFETDPALRDGLLSAAAENGVPTKTGVIASGDQFVADPAVKSEIVSLFGAIACEMEGAAVAQVCRANGVPCAVLRAISDGEGGAMDYGAFLHIAAERSLTVLKAFLL